MNFNHSQKYFFCYDRELFDTIKKNNFVYITKARNIDDGRIFTVFERNEDLKRIINKWTLAKSND